MTLEGRVCVVTGAGRGIGRATVLRLTAAGANVLAAARTAGDLEETAALAAGRPGRCATMVADVTQPDQVREMVARCLAEFGRLDVLVNNAGLAPLASIENVTDAMLDDVLAVNVKAVLYACRAAWPALKESHGTIINISSLAAADPFPGFAVYGGTKAWVNVFSQALAGEGKPLGIRVFVLGPGAVETQMLRQAFPKLPENQTLQPDEVAAAIEWLLDDRCAPMTGQTFYVRR